ncbi:MAG: glycosyltransferase family 2 protein [Thermoleophilia bacterium]
MTAEAPAASAPTASVVVCTYTAARGDLLRDALRRVGAQLLPGDELIVVVDHDDRLRDAIAADEPRARVVANAGAPGLSGARDSGIAAARGDVVVFLDDDALPRPGWLSALREAFADPRIEAVGGAVIPRWERGRPGWFPDELGWIVGCDYRGLPGDGAPIRNPIGANMGIRRGTLTRVGSFDGALGRDARRPMGCEETELAIRIRRESPGAGIVRIASAAVDHVVPPARATVAYALRRAWYEGISKGRLTARVGLGDGLASERRYVMRTLSAGVARHVGAAVTARDPAGIARALVLLAATATTAAGFLAGRR